MKNTKENNKLIAQFMGKEIYQKHHESNYHTSWDWLMPVIEKCLIGESEQSKEISNTTIKNIYESICNQDISFAHKSVIQFIKNKN